MGLIYSEKHSSTYGMIHILSIAAEDSTSEADYPVPIEEEEQLAAFALGGVQVGTVNETKIQMSVYLGKTELEASTWCFIRTGEIQVSKKGILEVGNSLSSQSMAKLALTPGNYSVSVYTDTGIADTTHKVAFVLEKIKECPQSSQT